MTEMCLAEEKKSREIPKEYEANLKFRAEILRDTVTDLELRDLLWELCDKDIISFFEMFMWTYDPRESPHDRPFIPYEYQADFIREINDKIERGENLLVEKTRDMGVTWCVLGVFMWRWLFKDDNFLLGSRKEELVDTIGDMDTHFERLRYILKAMPQWLKDYARVVEKNSGYMKMWKEDGASLVGESMNPNFSRQGRYKAILLDEFAFVEKAESVWRACGDSSPCKLVVSTPHGKHNHFARLRNSGKIKVIALGWKLHPKKTEEWYKEQLDTRSAKDVAQEIDINYTVSTGEAFYIGFSRVRHVHKLTINTEKEAILSWDFGFRHPNCSIHQIGVAGEWAIMDNLFGDDETIDVFGARVRAYLNTHYPEVRWISVGDPAGNQVNDKSKKTSIQILAELGFMVRSVPSNRPDTGYDARKRIIEKKLRSNIGELPELIVNNTQNCEIIVEGFEGGYRYPDENKYGFAKELPVKDGYYEHCMNTIEYVATNFFVAVARKKQKPKPKRPVVRDNI